MRAPYALFLIPALCYVQASAPALSPQAPAPKISFDKTHHDFGKISDDLEVSYRYRVTNTGSATLEIREIRPSCGCSYTMVGRTQLKPGEDTFIEVHFNPEGLMGTVHKSLQVISNDPAQPEVVLTFEASVVMDIMPSSTVVFFSEVARGGGSLTQSVRLQSGDGEAITVTDARIPGAPYLSCTPRQDGNDVVLDINLDASLIPRQRQRGFDNLAVRTTSTKIPILHFQVYWDVLSLITASPGRVVWTEAAGAESRATIQLKHPEGRAFRVLEAKTTSSLINVVWSASTSASEHELEVVMSARARAGGYHETLTLTFDDPEQQTLEIAIVAVLR